MNPQIRTESIINHTKQGLLVLCLLLSLALTAACDVQTPAHDLQTPEGRVELDAGNQPTGSTRGSTPGGFETLALLTTSSL